MWLSSRGRTLLLLGQLSWRVPSATAGTGMFGQLILAGMEGAGPAEGGVRRDTKNQLLPKAVPAAAQSLLTHFYLLVLQKKQGGRAETIFGR